MFDPTLANQLLPYSETTSAAQTSRDMPTNKRIKANAKEERFQAQNERRARRGNNTALGAASNIDPPSPLQGVASHQVPDDMAEVPRPSVLERCRADPSAAWANRGCGDVILARAKATDMHNEDFEMYQLAPSAARFVRSQMNNKTARLLGLQAAAPGEFRPPQVQLVPLHDDGARDGVALSADAAEVALPEASWASALAPCDDIELLVSVPVARGADALDCELAELEAALDELEPNDEYDLELGRSIAVKRRSKPAPVRYVKRWVVGSVVSVTARAVEVGVEQVGVTDAGSQDDHDARYTRGVAHAVGDDGCVLAAVDTTGRPALGSAREEEHARLVAKELGVGSRILLRESATAPAEEAVVVAGYQRELTGHVVSVLNGARKPSKSVRVVDLSSAAVAHVPLPTLYPLQTIAPLGTHVHTCGICFKQVRLSRLLRLLAHPPCSPPYSPPCSSPCSPPCSPPCPSRPKSGWSSSSAARRRACRSRRSAAPSSSAWSAPSSTRC